MDVFLTTISAFLPILLVMAFLYSAGIIVKVRVWLRRSRGVGGGRKAGMGVGFSMSPTVAGASGGRGEHGCG